LVAAHFYAGRYRAVYLVAGKGQHMSFISRAAIPSYSFGMPKKYHFDCFTDRTVLP